MTTTTREERGRPDAYKGARRGAHVTVPLVARPLGPPPPGACLLIGSLRPAGPRGKMGKMAKIGLCNEQQQMTGNWRVAILRDPSFTRAVKLAKALQVDLNSLYPVRKQC